MAANSKANVHSLGFYIVLEPHRHDITELDVNCVNTAGYQ